MTVFSLTANCPSLALGPVAVLSLADGGSKQRQTASGVRAQFPCRLWARAVVYDITALHKKGDPFPVCGRLFCICRRTAHHLGGKIVVYEVVFLPRFTTSVMDTSAAQLLCRVEHSAELDMPQEREPDLDLDLGTVQYLASGISSSGLQWVRGLVVAVLGTS